MNYLISTSVETSYTYSELLEQLDINMKKLNIHTQPSDSNMYVCMLCNHCKSNALNPSELLKLNGVPMYLCQGCFNKVLDSIPTKNS